jgi:beta-galactosidase
MDYPKFPEGFLWGTAISSFQVEMGRGEPSRNTDWFKWVTDEKNIIEKRVSGDSPEDGPGFWELFPNDFSLVKYDLKNNAIRISIDWGRIFPKTTENVSVNVNFDDNGNLYRVNIDESALSHLTRIADKKAVERYREIILEANRLNLQVLFTLYHWPIPLWLHEPISCRDNIEGANKKGWLDQVTIIEFAKYSAFIAASLGDLIDLYATINEPRIVSEHGYLSERGEFPPGLNDLELFLICMKNLSIAHGISFDQIKKWDKASVSDYGPATVGIVSVLQAYHPSDPSNRLDVEACRIIDYAFNEWCLNSVFRGEYDMNLDMVIQPMEKWPHLVKGCDFLGINYYSKWRVKGVEGSDPNLHNITFDPCLKNCSDYGWETYPEGLREMVKWAYERYRRPIYITENGIADSEDKHKVSYLTEHLKQLSLAINEDRIPIKGYFYWTLMDNFEWADGYKIKFGLYHVDKDTKKRIPSNAVKIYRNIASENRVLS